VAEWQSVTQLQHPRANGEIVAGPGDANPRTAQGFAAIRQIAALPYRSNGAGYDAPVSILLITSRESGRWVIPKGNPGAGASPHEAAAVEAEEEAGVRGAVCPTPLGSFRYRKRRSNGASLMFDVEVYPLSVTQELPAWKEAGERERRWFPLEEAANQVDEPDLADLIRSFDTSAFNRATRTTTFLGTVAQKSRVGPMFAWFQRLLPKRGDFFAMFEAHAATIVAGSNAMCRMVEGGPALADHLREIGERENDADQVVREVLTTVRQTFLTPFDRAAIASLIGSMDDTIDEMHAAAKAAALYEVSSFDQGMKDMIAIVVDAARVTAEAMPLLRDVGKNGARLHELTGRLIRMEAHADDIYQSGLKTAFQAAGGNDPMGFAVKRELYKHLERIIDAFESVAYEIDGIVIDHA
jgi:uncharacterized protein Yka (UPF0111/DUF47 family)/8-oxo-dGTP pyrophosphatase MutT (NUDIX family)